MVLRNSSKLDHRLQQFNREFCPSLRQLMDFLREAGISHYSSGCGLKSVTFDLFPASDQIAKLLSMLSLNRPYKATCASGLRDYSPEDGYNPAFYFIRHMQRWSNFATTVMHNEGDSARGIAAANAKVLLDLLIQRLGNAGKPTLFLRRRTPAKVTDFAILMQDVGQALYDEQQQSLKKRHLTVNYHRAMAAALRHKIA